MEIEGVMPAPAAHLPLPPVQGSAGTATSLVLRTIQLVAAAMSVAAMLSTDDYFTVLSFSFLVVAAGVQALWSFGMIVTDLDIMLIKNKAQNKWFLHALKFADTICSAVIFCAASAASGVVLLIRFDLRSCGTVHCQKFELAITRAFISFAATIPCTLGNWVTWSPAKRDEEGMPSETEYIIFILNMLGIVFACPSLGIGLLVNCHSPGTICNPNLALEFLIIGLFVLVFVSFLEVMCQILAVCYGATTLTGPRLTCLLLVAGKWVTSLWSLGAACATLGLTQLFFVNHLFDKSTMIYEAVFCATSLAAGICYAMSSCLRAHLVVSRLRQGATQQ